MGGYGGNARNGGMGGFGGFSGKIDGNGGNSDCCGGGFEGGGSGKWGGGGGAWGCKEPLCSRIYTVTSETYGKGGLGQLVSNPTLNNTMGSNGVVNKK